MPDDNEILERLSATGSTPDSVANLLRCAGYNGMTGIAIRRRLQKLEKEKAVDRLPLRTVFLCVVDAENHSRLIIAIC